MTTNMTTNKFHAYEHAGECMRRHTRDAARARRRCLRFTQDAMTATGEVGRADDRDRNTWELFAESYRKSAMHYARMVEFHTEAAAQWRADRTKMRREARTR